jgi:hypothetical protein
VNVTIKVVTIPNGGTRSKHMKTKKKKGDWFIERIAYQIPNAKTPISNQSEYTIHSFVDRRAEIIDGTTAARTGFNPGTAARAPEAVVLTVPMKEAAAVFADSSWAARIDREVRGAAGSGGGGGGAHFVLFVWWCLGVWVSSSCVDEMQICEVSIR